MTKEEKIKAIKEWEFKMKALNLKLKYSRSFHEQISTTLRIAAETVNAFTVIAQPKPTYPDGSIIETNNKPEIIELRNGQRIEVPKKT